MIFPSNSTFPPASYSPMIPLGIPSLPCPASPPIPSISPFFTSRDTFLTVSPGISTQSLSIFRTVGASSGIVLAPSLVRPSTLRPTMLLVMDATVMFSAFSHSTRTPSRITATVLHTDNISCNLCVMKMTDIPRSDIPRMLSRSASASFSVRTAVGSSSIRSRSCSLDSSLAISVNCLCPTGMVFIIMCLSMATPIFSTDSFARLSISARSRVFSLFPNISEIKLYFSGSLFNRMFSVASNPGISENSW